MVVAALGGLLRKLLHATAYTGKSSVPRTLAYGGTEEAPHATSGIHDANPLDLDCIYDSLPHTG